MIFAFFPAFLLFKASGVVEHQHFVARLLHHQAFGAGVNALVGVGGAKAIVAAANEGAHVINGKVG